MRRTGIIKKAPLLGDAQMHRFAKIPKAKWFDLYSDLFRQAFGERRTDLEVLSDAEKRLATMTANGLYDD